MKNPFRFYVLTLLLITSSACYAAIPVDDSPAQPGEWGFRPLDGSTIQTTPPNFSWRPQKGAAAYEIECALVNSLTMYTAKAISYTVHTPASEFEPGTWHWRFRFIDEEGKYSAWSTVRQFTIAPDARPLVLPHKEDLLARIPKEHPRLFVRPEQIPTLRERAQKDLKDEFAVLRRAADRILDDLPPTEEPPRYAEGMDRKSPEWLKIWWGNRVYTQKALGSAAELGFFYQISEEPRYGEAAKKLLLDCARWDPHGATGYRYNDEAGMPYNYYFARTYTFIQDRLTPTEKEDCLAVMRARGEEMYRHLCPNHLWKPYSSHSNRAWHFLGEMGIAFLDEIPEAGEWAWFAANVFANVYPVWSDEEGGWHEGVSYWNSYLQRFTWWADIMKAAMRINAFDKPYFSQIGYYPLYLQPPGTQGGGFGDLCASKTSRHNCELVSILAAQAQNPYWQWYVETQDAEMNSNGYVGFLRKSLRKPQAKAPEELPSSRCFWGIGQAVLNRNLLDAKNNVEIIFKSSPFGTQSHGYESNNSFLLYAFGERLFIRSGKRDYYGSPHHQQWMWQTRSTNCIAVNGQGQRTHSAAAQGRILAFHTSADFDYVAGEAGSAYPENVEQFTRRILFAKPDTLLIVDTLQAETPSTFQWYLHAPTKMALAETNQLSVQNGKAACQVHFLWPPHLQFSQTDQFDPPPSKGELVEYHLTAETRTPAKEQTFITVLFPHRAEDEIAPQVQVNKTETGFELTSTMNGRTLHTAFDGESLSSTLRNEEGQVFAQFAE